VTVRAVAFLAGFVGAGTCEDKGLQVRDERAGNAVVIRAVTRAVAEATLRMDLTLTNADSTARSPLTVRLTGEGRRELTRITPKFRARSMEYRYAYQWRIGLPGGQPDRHVYELPYSGRFRVSQGARGSTTHAAGTEAEHAIDFDLPEGTPVVAARDGTVVAERHDSTAGGDSPRYNECANYVVLRHGDGTYGRYAHLRPGEPLVRVGRQVMAGEIIGFAGRTGRVSGPHLHFDVYLVKDGNAAESLPITFRTADGSLTEAKEGEVYEGPQWRR
jgi:murein DD-endopeptidase MepM/ murein hydrolase activator NlpD